MFAIIFQTILHHFAIILQSFCNQFYIFFDIFSILLALFFVICFIFFLFGVLCWGHKHTSYALKCDLHAIFQKKVHKMFNKIPQTVLALRGSGGLKGSVKVSWISALQVALNFCFKRVLQQHFEHNCALAAV